MAKVLKTVVVIAVAVAVVVFAPQIAAVLASVAGSLGVTVAATALSSALIGMGISMALAAVATMFRKAPSMSQSLADRLNTSVVPTASRKIVFGTTAGGQDVRFFEGDVDLPSSKIDGYVQVIALASHRISAFRDFYVENDLVWSNGTFLKHRGGFAPNNPFRVVLEGKPGNGFSVGSGRYWNSTSTFTGCAYYVPFWKLDDKVWESGIPQRLTAIVDGCPVYDPRRDSTRGGSGSHRIDNQDTWGFRDGSVEYGRNPALALLTYLIGWRVNGKVVWGMGIPAHRIDFDNFRAYANVCEERVATQGGGTVQRYHLDGIFSTTDSHETIINGITAAMGSCKMTDRGGTYCLVGGYDDTAGPKIAFDADDLVAPSNGASPYIWNPAPPSRERFNIVRGRFANPDELYQLTDWGDPIEREPLADNIPRTLTLDLGGVSRPETCQRIAKQFLLREYLCPGKFSATFGPKAFAVEIGDVITLSLPAEGWNNKMFRVEEQAESHDMFFQMVLREEDPAIYAWDREEKPLPLSLRPQGYDASTTITPSNLQLSSASYPGSNGVNISEVHVTWMPEMSGRVGSIQIQSRPQGTTAWTEQAAAFDHTLGKFTFTANAPGITVEVQARFRMTSGVYSPWATAQVATAAVAINYDDVKDTPISLGDINPTEGGKLGGIEAGATVGGTIGSNIKNSDGSIYVPPSQGQLVDTTPPAVPTNLSLTSTLTDAGTTLSATWTGVNDSDLAGYVLAIKQGAGNYVEFVGGLSTSYERTAMPRNTAFTAKVAAYDKAGNRSAFTPEFTLTTARDTVAPSPVTAVQVQTTFNSAFVSWTNPTDADLKRVEVRLVNSIGQGTVIGTQSIEVAPGTKGSATWSNLTKGTTYSCHLLAYDTSGNEATVTNSGNFTTAGGVAASDFTPGLEPIRTVTSLPAASGYTGPSVVFYNGELYRYADGAWKKSVDYADVTSKPTSLSAINSAEASKLSGIAAGATVGAPLGTMVGNTPAGTVESRSNDPAARVNELNTTINGAKITNGTVNADKLGAIIGGGNLIRNSSFEAIYAHPAGAMARGFTLYDNSYPGDTTTCDVQANGRRGGLSQLVTWQKNSSTKGIYLTNSGHGVTNNANIFKPNTTYVVSIYARGAGSATQGGLSLRWNRAPVETVEVANPLITSEWQRYVFRIRFGTNVDAECFITTTYGGTTAGYLYFDDIQIEEGEVATAYAPALLPGEVTGDLIAANAITETKISDDAITTRTIAANAITADELSANSVTGNKIVSRTIGAQHIATGTLTANEIAANTITATQIASKTIGAGQIAASSITALEIAANTIDANNIKSAAITTDKLRVGSMTELNPDPGFRDTTFWVNDGAYPGPLGTTSGSNNGWYNTHSNDINQTLGTTNYCMLWEVYFKGSARQHLISNRRTSIRAGGVYELSAVCRNASNQRINILCRMYDVNGGFVADAIVFFDAGAWDVKRTQFTVPNGVNSYCFYVYNEAGVNFAGNCQVSNLQVREAVASTTIQNGAITTDKLTAGAVTTNKLAVNGRQISVAELNLRHKDGVLSWNAANIVYVNDAGDAVYNGVPGGSVTGAGYLCYRPGASALEYIGSYSIRANPAYFTICYFDGGTTLAPIANTSTVINGGNIQTDTIDANKIKSKSITAGQIAGGTITANEVATGTLTAAQMATGSLTASVVAVGNPDNVIGDSDFRDPKWWNSGVADGRLTVGETGMTENRRELLINPGGGIDVFSMFFPVEPGATYRISLGVYTYPEFSGSFRPMIHVPGVIWMSLKGSGVGMDPSDTNPAHNYTAAGQYHRNTFVFTNPGGSDQGKWQFRLGGSWTGKCAFTVKVVRVSDTTLIANGAVTTEKMVANSIAGDRITAGTLDASKITANTIGTGQLSVGLQTRTLNNLLNTSFWGGGDMNTVPGWNSNNAGANAWYVGISPTGGAEPLLRMVANTNDANGGWNVAVTTADGFSPNKAYRYYTWYFAESGNNSYYHGTDYVQTLGGGDIGNPYFFAGGKQGLPMGRWLLFVGVVQPAGSTMADSGISGVWDPISGRRIIPGSDFRWRPGTTTGYFRSYQYYGDVGGVSYYTKPVVEEVVAGQTPSLTSLMQQLDYATNINGGSTLIAPGKVLIQGGTSLDNWRDQTEIRGGAIKANTVTAEKIAINARGITALGLDFRYQDGRLHWSDGHVLYTDDAGNASSPYIPAGSVAWNGGSYNYILWDKGAGGFRHVVDAWEQSQNRNANSVIMVTWRGGSNFVANIGGTIISGDRIVTRSISAAQIQAGTIGAYEIAANSITADRLSVSSLSALSANIGLLRTASSGARQEIEGNQTRVYDGNGTLRVRFGVW